MGTCIIMYQRLLMLCSKPIIQYRMPIIEELIHNIPFQSWPATVHSSIACCCHDHPWSASPFSSWRCHGRLSATDSVGGDDHLDISHRHACTCSWRNGTPAGSTGSRLVFERPFPRNNSVDSVAECVLFGDLGRVRAHSSV